MKKSIIICAVILTVLLSTGVVVALSQQNSPFTEFFNIIKNGKKDSEIILYVNGEPVYKSEMDVQISYNKLTYNLLKSQQENNSLYAQNSELYDKQIQESISKSNEEITNDIIKSKIMVQQAQRLGISADYDDAYKQHKSNYEVIKKQADENYRFIALYIEEMGITEEEYLEQAANSYCNLMTKYNLQTYYSNNKELTAEFESFDDYIQNLIDNADIKYTELFYN